MNTKLQLLLVDIKAGQKTMRNYRQLFHSYW